MTKTTTIVPTTGNPKLEYALKSLANQTINVRTYIVIDGEQYKDKVYEILKNKDIQDYVKHNCSVCCLPNNTGKDGWYGHRIYSSFPYLIDTEYISFLDEDNEYEKNHIEMCERVMESDKSLDWCYSLRKIVSNDGEFLCNDDCESLGYFWNPYHPVKYQLIDTNCYFLKTITACQNSKNFYKKDIGDREYFYGLMRNRFNGVCTGLYTVRYRLGNKEASARENFFRFGNAYIKGLYNDSYPWRKQQ